MTVSDLPSLNPSYRYCPLCGNTLGLKLVKAGDPQRPVCSTCGYIVYFDPKVAVGTIIRSNSGDIALVRRSIEPGYGKWVFPGGYVDRGEEPVAAARREALEEACLEIQIEGLINIYSYPAIVPIIIVYASTVSRGELKAGDESLEARWFTANNLPWDELAFRSTTEALQDHLHGILHSLGR